MGTSINWGNIGKRIQGKRKANGMTQDDLVDELHISSTHLSRIESGKQIPSFPLFLEICNQLKTNPDYFILGNTRSSSVSSEIIDSLQLLSPRDQEIIKTIIEKMILLSMESN